MSNVFAKFDKQFDVKGLKEDLKNVSSNSADYKEVPLVLMRLRLKNWNLWNLRLESQWFLVG